MSKLLIGTVRKDCEKDLRGLEGIQLLTLQLYEEDKKLCLLHPIQYEEIEKFYKFGFENGGKEHISEDYNYFLWYLINEDCELISNIDLEQLENVREITKEEDHEAFVNFEKFKFQNKFYDKEVTYKAVKITKELIRNIEDAVNPMISIENKNIEITSLKLFEFDGGERDYIISDCFNNAMRYYVDMMEEGILTEEEYKVKEIKKWHHLELTDEEEDGTLKKITVIEAVKEFYPNKYTGPIYLATTCS